jgi:phage I-like protein
VGSKSTDQKHRSRLRKHLRSLGYDEATVDAIVAERADVQRRRREAATAAAERAERLRHQEAELDEARTAAAPFEPPDDAGYKPRRPDPLLVGVARATGETARAVKRSSTLLRTEVRR